MNRLPLATALLFGSTLIVRAGDSAPPPSAPSPVIAATGPKNLSCDCPKSQPRKFGFHRRYAESTGAHRGFFAPVYTPPSTAKPFVYDNHRYEPNTRDIRFVPNSINLPTGKDYGAREMLPILPDRSAGYFVLPLR